MDLFEPLPRGATVKERLEAYSIPEPNSGCWLWAGMVNQYGYGRLRVNGDIKLCHRLSYEVFCDMIPSGAHVLHRCDTPSCVNPGHLFLGTNLDNIADKVAKGRQHRPRGEKNGSAVLTEHDIIQIRAMAKTTSAIDISVLFGKNRRTIRDVINGKTWRHLLPPPD